MSVHLSHTIGIDIGYVLSHVAGNASLVHFVGITLSLILGIITPVVTILEHITRASIDRVLPFLFMAGNTETLLRPASDANGIRYTLHVWVMADITAYIWSVFRRHG